MLGCDCVPVQAGKTAVMLAIEKGHEGFLKLLIAARADLNEIDKVSVFEFAWYTCEFDNVCVLCVFIRVFICCCFVRVSFALAI